MNAQQNTFITCHHFSNSALAMEKKKKKKNLAYFSSNSKDKDTETMTETMARKKGKNEENQHHLEKYLINRKYIERVPSSLQPTIQKILDITDKFYVS